MSKYIAFEFLCEANSWTQKVQTCVHNLFLKYVTPTCHTSAASMLKFDFAFSSSQRAKSYVEVKGSKYIQMFVNRFFNNMHKMNVLPVPKQPVNKFIWPWYNHDNMPSYNSSWHLAFGDLLFPGSCRKNLVVQKFKTRDPSVRHLHYRCPVRLSSFICCSETRVKHKRFNMCT